MINLNISRFFEEPQQSYFLLGPRGTGKSTFAISQHPNALLINLLLSDVRRRYSTHPEQLLDVVRAQPRGQTIIIDEIQKVPDLLSLVHVLIEEKQEWQFILTGSSARKLKRGDTNLLGGRALKKTLHPFMAAELGEHFNFTEALQYGLLPLRFAAHDIIQTLSSYVSLYLEEEVKMEGLVRQIDPFARFLEVLSFSQGSILNLSNIARECGIKNTTINNWLSIVEDLLIVYRVPVFTKRAKRILVAQPKLYFFDVGIYNTLRPISVLGLASEIQGPGLEGLVAQHLRAWIDYTKSGHSLYFWRTKAGLEVDFIVYGALGLWAIEVKNSQYIHPADLRPLEHFKEDYPEAQTILLYRGKERMLKKNILCIPCEEFLVNMVPNQPLLGKFNDA